MNFRFTVLETSLNRAEFRWKWLRFVRFSSILGICLSLLLAGLGLLVITGGLTSKVIFLTVFAIIGAAGVIAWILIAIGVMASEPNRNGLAAAIERIDRRFLDRLNTLLFLENRRSDARSHSFSVRIARQTQDILTEKDPPAVFSPKPALAWFATFVLVLGAVFALNRHYLPWNQLVLAEVRKNAPVPPAEKPLDLALPATNNVEQNKAWGEVRITDPGMDLRVTKVDVVPLQIEAAANDRLQNVDWFTTLNGSNEVRHPLPAPPEPRYATYQPDIYLDELNLSDWDVITYYAKAATERSNTYASEIYFLEVRPFREDIAKMPGGEGGKAYKNLNQISGLIGRQQHVIRETHQHLQNPPPQENVRKQDRQKLAEAESDLGDSARHLYAEMAAEMENKPIGEALDNLAKAEKSLKGAGEQLEASSMPEAQNSERTALSELVAARKMFQKAVSDNPDSFKDGDQQDTEPAPVADSVKKLNQMAEFRNEAKAAQEMMQRTLEQQRRVEQQTRTAPLNQYSRLADEEQKLQRDLQNFAEQHPRAFKGSEAQAKQSQEAMAKAAKALQNRRGESKQATQQARENLEKLAQNMEAQNAGQQMANAYKLKQMLDQQISKLNDRAQPGSQMADADLRATARDAQETVDQLKKSAEQDPTRDAFGQPLRDALSGQNKAAIDQKLRQLQRAEDEQSKQQGAAEAGTALGKVSEAFNASQPKSLQMARKTDSLKQSEQGSFSQGMAELDSLLKQLQRNQLSKENQSRQGQQALADLQTGMRSQFGDNEAGQQLLAQFEQMLKADAGLEPGDLKKLMEKLQHFSVETSEQLARKDDQPEVNNIDPARLPPAYRNRIQKYFEKLSEH